MGSTGHPSYTSNALTDVTNIADRLTNKQTNSFKPTTVSGHFLCNNQDAIGMQLIPLELVKSNRDSVVKQEKQISLNTLMQTTEIFLNVICYD